MTEDEAASRITAGMRGVHTRRQLQAGNVLAYADTDRAEKIRARNERMAAAQGMSLNNRATVGRQSVNRQSTVSQQSVNSQPAGS